MLYGMKLCVQIHSIIFVRWKNWLPFYISLYLMDMINLFTDILHGIYTFLSICFICALLVK